MGFRGKILLDHFLDELVFDMKRVGNHFTRNTSPVQFKDVLVPYLNAGDDQSYAGAVSVSLPYVTCLSDFNVLLIRAEHNKQ